MVDLVAEIKKADCIEIQNLPSAGLKCYEKDAEKIGIACKD